MVRCDECGKEIKGPVYYPSVVHYAGRGRYARTVLTRCSECKPDWCRYDERRCPVCGRLFYTELWSNRRYCSKKCAHRGLYLKRKRERARRRQNRVCPVCGKPFDAVRSDQVYCSAACKQAAYRKRAREEAEVSPLRYAEEYAYQISKTVHNFLDPDCDKKRVEKLELIIRYRELVDRRYIDDLAMNFDLLAIRAREYAERLREMELTEERLEEVKEIVDRALAKSGLTSREPRYAYWEVGKDRYFWTIEPVVHEGKKRFVSGIYRYIKSKNAFKLTRERYHKRRKDAKARAWQLFQEAEKKNMG